MSVTPVSDPIRDSLEKLTSVFQGKPKIASLLSSFAGPSAILQQISGQMLTQRSLYTALGAQLDGIGSIVGEARRGRSDFDYRRAIIIRIAINTSKGTPEDAINVFALVTGSTIVQLLEYFPGVVSITGNVNFEYGYTHLGPDSFAFFGGVDGLGFGDYFDTSTGGVFVGLVIYDVATLYRLIDSVLPAGVRLDYLAYYDGTSFSFDEDAHGGGFGDYFDSAIGGGFATIVVP